MSQEKFQPTRPRRLLLCLDGVPHELIKAAQGRGLFEYFNRPTRLLSPFPTMTNVALSAMFHASPPPGYESLYFDRNARELRGGIRKYLGRRTPDKIPSSYMDELDYQEPLAFEFLIYVAAETVWRSDMQRFREHFRIAPRDRDYFAFLKATDGLLHSRGPDRLAVALKSLDRILKEIRQVCGQETEIVLFSDHGMNLRENHRSSLLTHLQRSGFKVSSNLINPGNRAVSIPAFGLCSYAAAYCVGQDIIPEAAEALINVPGVDFAVYRDGSDVAIEGHQGSARIQRREVNGDSFFCYVARSGDPLKLEPIAQSLRAAGKLDSDGFGHDAVWFAETNSHFYPDALSNIYFSLTRARVRHTADILLSMSDGYYFGWSPFGRIVRLAATHGNAQSPSSNAFMMSTHRELPECVRADNARTLLRD